jgi:hypothetical protein
LKAFVASASGTEDRWFASRHGESSLGKTYQFCCMKFNVHCLGYLVVRNNGIGPEMFQRGLTVTFFSLENRHSGENFSKKSLKRLENVETSNSPTMAFSEKVCVKGLCPLTGGEVNSTCVS